MQKPEKHIFVCASFRLQGTPQGVCQKKGSANLLGFLENEISDRGLDGVSVTSTGCLKVCERGPVMVVYPENTWYGGVDSEEAVDAILDALESGKTADKLILK
jgi:(2Fe-2S) ferredoxin